MEKKDEELLFKLLKMDQKQVYYFLKEEINKYYPMNKNYKRQNGYIYRAGSLPVLLVAHMDTVYDTWIRKQELKIFHDREENTIWSPYGLGADDRAGVFLILKILESGLKPHILFTSNEETNCYGAKKFIQDYARIIKKSNIKYLIELDRQGSNDCVFYDCINSDFEQYVNSYGFETQEGLYSDISYICIDIGIAGVNLSIGYHHEHSLIEYLNIEEMMHTFSIVCNMVKDSVFLTETFIYKDISEYDNEFLLKYFGYSFMEDEFLQEVL